MTNTLAQAISHTDGGLSTVTTLSTALGSAGAANNLYLILCSDLTRAETITPSDNQNGAVYTPENVFVTGNSAYKSIIYSALNGVAAIATATAGFSPATYATLTFLELAGGPTTSFLDSTGTGHGGAGTPGLTITTTTANCSIFSVFCGAGISAATLDAGYSSLFALTNLSTGGYHIGEYILDAGAAGTKTLHYGFSGAVTGDWAMVAAAYKTTAAPGGLAANPLAGGGAAALPLRGYVG